MLLYIIYAHIYVQGKERMYTALFPPSLLTGKKECTPTLLLSRLLLILERKSVPLHSPLPDSNWPERVYSYNSSVAFFLRQLTIKIVLIEARLAIVATHYTVHACNVTMTE